MLKHKKSKGSITVEAVISFAVFVSFMFLLLSMVKIALIKVTVNNAVVETAKTIATYSYPLGMYNDIAEEYNDKVSSAISSAESVANGSKEGTKILIDSIFKNMNLSAGGFDGILSKISGGTDTLIKSVVLDASEQLISAGAPKVVSGVLGGIIEDSYVSIDEDKLKIDIAKLPMSEKMYKSISNNSAFTDYGLTASDFNEDDVVIGVSYIYKVTFPLIGSIDMKIKEAVVEHAWVNGSSGNIPNSKEGINPLDMIFGGEKVYVTSTGNKYHKEDCFYLLRSKKELKKSQAIGQGYIPCVRCCP